MATSLDLQRITWNAFRRYLIGAREVCKQGEESGEIGAKEAERFRDYLALLERHIASVNRYYETPEDK